MPPRKKLPPADYRALVDSHHIHFLGPRPPNDWPVYHKQLFSVIRDIGALRYEEFQKRRDIDSRICDKVRANVRKLCARASEIRQDVHINENEWRHHIEQLVLGRLDNAKDVVCNACGHETWAPVFEALPLEKTAKDKLKDKRRGRLHCTCQGRGTKFENDDDEKGPVFHTHMDRLVSHGPEDADLDKLPISRKPDRVVGLGLTREIKAHALATEPILTHSPVTGGLFTYPFLLVEAKKERNSPGFRAIEMQTAFPVRRLLQIQDSLRVASKIYCEPPLVWFFAYQGDDWRLYAGTSQTGVVNMYELWRGTVESRDGALQVLQIVDYIWSWARDVYRPQIQACLHSLVVQTNAVLVYPAGGHNYTPSNSSASEPPSSYYSQDLTFREDTSSEDEGEDNPREDGHEDEVDVNDETHMMSETHSKIDKLGPGPGLEDDTMTDNTTHLRDCPSQAADAHHFLRWAPGNQYSQNWTSSACIRHSNLVRFSFLRIYAPSSELSSTCLQQAHFFTTNEDLYELERYWTGRLPITERNHEVLSVSLCFRTFLEPDWQINRQICCLEWAPQQAQQVQRGMKFPDLPKAFEGLHLLGGSLSVLCALQEYTLVAGLPYAQDRMGNIEPRISWDVLSPRDTFAIFSQVTEPSREHSHVRLVPPTVGDSGFFARFPRLPSGLTDGTSLLAKRPSRWPHTSPQFCVFAFEAVSLEAKTNLVDLLDEAKAKDNIFIDGGRDFSEEDWHTLDEWLAILRQIASAAQGLPER